MKNMQGMASTTLRSHMAEFMYRHRNGGEGTEIFDSIIRHIAEYFPVNNWLDTSLQY